MKLIRGSYEHRIQSYKTQSGGPCTQVSRCSELQFETRLVVGLLLQPSSRVAAQVEAARLVVDEDGQHEGQSRQPPHEPADRRFTLATVTAKYATRSVLHQSLNYTHFKGNILRPLSIPGV